MTSSCAPHGRRRRTCRLPARQRHLTVAVLVAALVLSVLAATIPGSGAALTAVLTNSTNTVTTQPYFTCAAAITANSPRVYYKLDEAAAASTAVDSSGTGRNGTYQGLVTKGVADACVRDPGTAVTFNGSTGYVSLTASLSVPATYSLSAWFKTTSTTGGLIAGFGALATGSSSTVDRVVYMTASGALVFGNNNANKTTIASPTTYRDGQWHHVMATVGTNGMRLYVDGSQVASSTAVATTSYTGFFRVGYDNLTGWPSAPPSSYFNGTLDEVAAYSTTLTATDALNHDNAGS